MWSAIGLILLLPLVAMQFTREVAWTGHDFAVAATLLVGGGIAYEMVVARTRSGTRRRLIGGVILALVLLIWIDGAVGIL